MFWPTDKEYIVGTASPAELVRSISTDVVEISFIVQATFVEKDVHLPERFREYPKVCVNLQTDVR